MLTTSQDQYQDVYQAAASLYNKATDWVTFFRQVIGIDGIIRRAFPGPQQLSEFEHSKEYADIQQMLAKLREKSAAVTEDQEPTKVITVRLPKCLHESLRSEAHERKTSMNKLCISKLLQIIDGQLVPTDTGN